MEKIQANEMLDELGIKRGDTSNSIAKKIDIRLIERILKRVEMFGHECSKCNSYITELEDIIEGIYEDFDSMDKESQKRYQKRINKIITHLHKSHKLVTDGYYMPLYMSLGICLGLVFGIAVFNNVGIGMPIGMCMGIVIGAAMDSGAKKKGLVI